MLLLQLNYKVFQTKWRKSLAWVQTTDVPVDDLFCLINRVKNVTQSFSIKNGSKNGQMGVDETDTAAQVAVS